MFQNAKKHSDAVQPGAASGHELGMHPSSEHGTATSKQEPGESAAADRMGECAAAGSEHEGMILGEALLAQRVGKLACKRQRIGDNSPADQWSCAVCTLENQQGTSRCGTCNHNPDTTHHDTTLTQYLVSGTKLCDCASQHHTSHHIHSCDCASQQFLNLDSHRSLLVVGSETTRITKLPRCRIPIGSLLCSEFY